LPLLFYGGLLLALLGVLVPVWPAVLPGPLASRIGNNTEAFSFALVLAAWIQFVRPRLTGSSREVLGTVCAAVLFLAAGLGLLVSGWDSRFVTLNEPLVALSVLIPFVQLRRPWARRLAVPLAGTALLVMVVGGERISLVTDQAESLGFLLLVPVALDVVDRGVLDPSSTTSVLRRRLWYAALVVAPVLLSVVQYRLGVDGLVGTGTRFGVRIAESFIGALLLSLYFAVGLGWTGRHRTR